MALPAVLYGALAFTIPESPRYLVASHKIPEARRVLSRLLGQKNLEITITRIKETLEREDDPSWRDLRKPTGGLYGIVWVGLGLSIFQQFVGINVIFYYCNVLWQAVGFSADESAIYTVITSVINVLTTLIAIALIDRIGRKPLLLIGSTGMAITLITMSVIFANATRRCADGNPSLPGASGVIALIAANLFVVAFGMSWGPVVWVLLGEMFPNRIRAAALGLAAAGQWAANWLITVTFPGLREHLGLAYGFYGLVRGAVRPVRLAVGDGDQGRVAGGHARRRSCARTRPRPARTAGCGRARTSRSRPVRPDVTQSPNVKTFDALFAELSERARTRPAGSGTVAALDGGVHGIGKKILEEAGEVWLAAEHENDEALAEEISQLLYWTQVLMLSRGLSLADVYGKL